MNPDELGLLRAICAEPADDTVRLGYADWLDENHEEVTCGCDDGAQDTGGTDPSGNPVYQECWVCNGTGRLSDNRQKRAEFIRVQCKLKSNDPAHCTHKALTRESCRWCELRRRELSLFQNNSRDWFADLGRRQITPCLCDPTGSSVASGRLIRGFVSHLFLSAADWLRHADTLYWHPAQTVACEAPYDPKRDFGYRRGTRHNQCDVCKGTGRVPRPFVPTAQPLEAVTLTTDVLGVRYADPQDPVLMRLPGRDWRPVGRYDPSESHEVRVLRLLEAEWPGITFHLPQPVAST